MARYHIPFINKLLSPLFAALLMLCVSSCAIEPPLRLADLEGCVNCRFPIVITDLDIIWDVDYNWEDEWYYGWDENDRASYGPLAYADPTSFEVRRYFRGSEPDGPTKAFDAFTVNGYIFTKNFRFGWYDMLIWSNIDSDDGAQTVIINEEDRESIYATTSPTRLNYRIPQQREPGDETPLTILNQPETFFNFLHRGTHITDNPADYDYIENDIWYKRLHVDLEPVVYIYLVQVILKNNNDRIIGISDNAAISGLADGVSLHTLETSKKDVHVSFPMRLKNGIDVEGENCDIFGGRLTTFGLCGMQAWSKSRGAIYKGTRADVENKLSLNVHFHNDTHKVLTYDITDQMQKKAHGGVITIVIDVDNIKVPLDPDKNGGFHPDVGDYNQKEEDFEI